MQRRNALLAALLLTLGSVACGYDSNGSYDPNPPADTNTVAGSYQATFLTNTVGKDTTDLIKFGLIYTMTLESDNTMTGRYVIDNGTPTPPNPFNVTGTWTQERDSSITVIDNANTFISGITLRKQMGRLEGMKIRGESTVRIVFERREEG